MAKEKNVMVIGSNYILGNKIYEILKRNHKVTGIQLGSADGRKGLRTIKLLEMDRIIGLAVYEQIRSAVIDSWVLGESIRQYGYDRAQELMMRLIKLLSVNSIGIVYLSIQTIECEQLINTQYRSLNQEICKEVYSVSDSYIVEIDKIYGAAQCSERYEHNAVEDGNRACLVDDIALFLAENLNSRGYYKFINDDFRHGINIVQHQNNCVFKLVYKQDALEHYNKRSVAQLRMQLGQYLAAVLPDNLRCKVDFVCPVPNTGIYYAMGLAMELKLPYLQALSKSTQNERSFQIECTDDRKKFLWSKIQPIPELLKGKKIILVDEAIFTGTTLKVVCEMLLECGVAEIYICIPTPKCSYHCNYLVHPLRPMLLEYINENMLQEYFNVTEVFFQSDVRFSEVVDSINSKMCVECFSGRK